MAKSDWQKIWDDTDIKLEDDKKRLDSVLETRRWKLMSEQIEKDLGGVSGIESIEVGAGLGDFSLVLASCGASPTLADYSEKALDKARARFEGHGQKAHFVMADMLNVPNDLKDRYDVSFSLGLAEHFYGEDRLKIVKAHLDVLKPGGLTFISVPYRYSPLYRIWMAHRKMQGTWEYGLEVPFSQKEIRQLGEAAGFETIGFIHSSFFADWNGFYPQHRVRRLFGHKFEKPSRFDSLSYALVYVGRRPR